MNSAPLSNPSHSRTLDRVKASLTKRRRSERRFRALGLISIGIGLLALFLLFGSIIGNGYSAFERTEIGLDVFFDPSIIDPEGTRQAETLQGADYDKLLKSTLAKVSPM